MNLPQKPLIIPIFIPHAGCPHQCVFCNQKVITGTEWLTFAGVVVSAVVGFKEGAKAYISKQNTKQQNGVTNGNSQ